MWLSYAYTQQRLVMIINGPAPFWPDNKSALRVYHRHEFHLYTAQVSSQLWLRYLRHIL